VHVPDAIGRYSVTGVIGTGAFSAVYRAIDERLGSEVAIKLLGDHHSLDPEIRERFIAEARLLRRVQSANVVRLFDLDETERHQPFHVLELLLGGNLASHRKLMTGRGVRVTSADVESVSGAVTEALRALHEQRIVHRDLTPSNLLLRRGSSAPAGPGVLAEHEELVLADLGLSKDLAVSSGLTAAGGTEGFAAPEQRSAGTVDERTDVFAASALVTWFVLGHPPGRSDATELAEVGWPGELGAALSAGLAVVPERRPTTIAEWRDGVLGALRPPPPPIVVEAPRFAVVTRPRRRWLAGAAVAVVVAGGAGFAAATVLDDADPNRTTVTHLDGGRVRFEATSGDVTAWIDGPAELVVGREANLLAGADGAESWTWATSGGSLDDASILPITPRTTGRLAVSLLVSPDVGVPFVVEARFDVVEPASS
jgi:tRNA A-37 threonylcarbamoyl transferase component Bud32